MTEPDILTRLRQTARLIEPELLNAVINEILQMRAAVAVSDRAATRWQARAERAERELDQWRRSAGESATT